MASLAETIIFSGNVVILIGTLIVGLIVLYNGFTRKMGNLSILGLMYLLTSSAKVIGVVFSLEWAEFAYFQTGVALLILEFTRRTFYKGREDARNKIIIFYVTTITTYLIASIFAYQYIQSGQTSELRDRTLYNIAATFDILTVVLPNVFTIMAAREAIGLLDPEIVEKYILSRLQLWINLSFIFALAYAAWIFEIIFPGEVTYAVLNTISTVVGLIYMIGSYLLWALPTWFREYLNQGSQVTSDVSDEELEGMDSPERVKGDTLNILGAYLAEYINTSELAARGHLRYAAQRAFPDQPVRKFNYVKWQMVIDQHLATQLGKLKLDVDPDKISKLMNDQLKKSQSIITMAAN